MGAESGDAADLERTRELKVRIPVRIHLQLMSLKLLTGKQMSDAVAEALDAYFAKFEPAPGVPAPDLQP